MKKILFALFAFLFLVACEDEPTTEIVKALRLSVDKEAIFADDTEIVTFIVKDENSNLVSDATIYILLRPMRLWPEILLRQKVLVCIDFMLGRGVLNQTKCRLLLRR